MWIATSLSEKTDNFVELSCSPLLVVSGQEIKEQRREDFSNVSHFWTTNPSWKSKQTNKILDSLWGTFLYVHLILSNVDHLWPTESSWWLIFLSHPLLPSMQLLRKIMVLQWDWEKLKEERRIIWSSEGTQTWVAAERTGSLDNVWQTTAAAEIHYLLSLSKYSTVLLTLHFLLL